MEEQVSQVIILGSGPAGYSAAIYCARAMLNPVLITGNIMGGQLSTVQDIENYPGYENPVSGPFLMDQMAKQAKFYGTEFICDHIIAVDLAKRPFTLKGESGKIYKCKTLIIATGANAKWLGLKSEEHFKGRGVSACATCDGFFYRGKNVAVIGGGNVAVEEALYLSNLAQKVTLIHRRGELRAEKILQERLFSKKNINILWNHVLEDVTGQLDSVSKTEVVGGLKLKNLLDDSLTKLEVEGVFIAIGHAPASEIFAPYLERSAAGYIITKPDSTKTNIDAVFAAGDITNTQFRQAVVAAGHGCMAALEVEHFLMLNK